MSGLDWGNTPSLTMMFFRDFNKLWSMMISWHTMFEIPEASVIGVYSCLFSSIIRFCIGDFNFLLSPLWIKTIFTNTPSHDTAAGPANSLRICWRCWSRVLSGRFSVEDSRIPGEFFHGRLTPRKDPQRYKLRSYTKRQKDDCRCVISIDSGGKSQDIRGDRDKKPCARIFLWYRSGGCQMSWLAWWVVQQE